MTDPDRVQVTAHNVAHMAINISHDAPDRDTLRAVCSVVGLQVDHTSHPLTKIERWWVTPKSSPVFTGTIQDVTKYVQGYASAWAYQQDKARKLLAQVGQQILVAAEKY